MQRRLGFEVTTAEGDEPRNFDWTTSLPMIVNERIIDQGSCGSCWAFTSANAIEGAYALRSYEVAAEMQNRTRAEGVFYLPQLSRQQILDWSNFGCDGGRMYSIVTRMLMEGYSNDFAVVTQQQYGPYVGYKQELKTNGVNEDFFVKVAGVRHIGNSICDIKNALVNWGPLMTAMWVDDDASYLHLYESGIIPHDSAADSDTFSSSGPKLNHAVTFVGYGFEGSRPFWKLKNSWGNDWGENGFFRIDQNQANGYGVLNTHYLVGAISVNDVFDADKLPVQTTSNASVMSLSLGLVLFMLF
jgi:hypothetical protein